MLNMTAPHLKEALSPDGLREITAEKFQEICMGVHAIKDYSRRVANKAVALPEGTAYTVAQKVAALSARIWNDRSSAGGRLRELLQYVLYDGPAELLPERLWRGVNDPKWKIDGLGISALGETVRLGIAGTVSTQERPHLKGPEISRLRCNGARGVNGLSAIPLARPDC